MNKRLFAICVASVLALAGSASAQSASFFGFGITCHKGYVGTPGAAYPSSTFPTVAAAAFPTPAFAFPTYYAANSQPGAAPPAPAAAPPAGNGDLVAAIDRLTAAINTLSGKVGNTPTTTNPKTSKTLPDTSKDKNSKDFPILSAPRTPRDNGEALTAERKKITSLVAEADALRANRGKADNGLASR
jgi:hypothetical protein